ncbi:MAG: VCBS repeat-containing protein, partial [Limisphaerales bacterium]
MFKRFLKSIGRAPKPSAQVLEPRVMLDAAAVEPALQEVQSQDILDNNLFEPSSEQSSDGSENDSIVAATIAEPSSEQSTRNEGEAGLVVLHEVGDLPNGEQRHILFVEVGQVNSTTLAQITNPAVTTVGFQNDGAAIELISEYLESAGEYDAITVISGSDLSGLEVITSPSQGNYMLGGATQATSLLDYVVPGGSVTVLTQDVDSEDGLIGFAANNNSLLSTDGTQFTELSEAEISDELDRHFTGGMAPGPGGMFELDYQAHFTALEDQGGRAALQAANSAVSDLISAFTSDFNSAANSLRDMFAGDPDSVSSVWNLRATLLLDELASGALDLEVELRSHAEMWGGYGAFAEKGPDGSPIIYLNADWIKAGATEADIVRIVVEEFGHYIDARLNPETDTVGDEGQKFANNLIGTNDSESPFRFSGHQDHFTLTIDGQRVEVEMAALLFDYPTLHAGEQGLVGDPDPIRATLEENKMHTYDIPGAAKALFVSDPPDAKWFSGNNVRGTLYVFDADNNLIVQDHLDPTPWAQTDPADPNYDEKTSTWDGYTGLGTGSQYEGGYYGEISRLIKTGSYVDGMQMYLYKDEATSSGSSRDLNASLIIVRDGLSGTQFNYDDPATTGVDEFSETNIGTSSDPVASALNDMLEPFSVTASADAATAQEAGGVNNATAGYDATGTIADNVTATGKSYSIVGGKLVETSGVGTLTEIVAPDGTLHSVNAAGATIITGSYGTLTIEADGTYTYAVDDTNPEVEALRSASDTLSESFQYTVTGGGTSLASSTLTITVEGQNDTPVAEVNYNVAKESLLPDGDSNQYSANDPVGLIATGNVLPNDTDVDQYGETSQVVGVTASADATTSGGSSELTFNTAQNSIGVGAYTFYDGGSTLKYPLLTYDGTGDPTLASSYTHVQVAAEVSSTQYVLSGEVTHYLVDANYISYDLPPGGGDILGFANNASGTSNYKTSMFQGASTVSN